MEQTQLLFIMAELSQLLEVEAEETDLPTMRVADQMDLLVALAVVLEQTFKMSLMELPAVELVALEQLVKEMTAVMEVEAEEPMEAEAEERMVLVSLWDPMVLVKNYSDIVTSNSHKVVSETQPIKVEADQMEVALEDLELSILFTIKISQSQLELD